MTGEVEIFSVKRRVLAALILGGMLVSAGVVLTWGLWWMVRLIFD